MRSRRIVADPSIMLGKPVIKGTRITVESILDKLRRRETWDQILYSFPNLEPEDIEAALAYAAESVHDRHAA